MSDSKPAHDTAVHGAISFGNIAIEFGRAAGTTTSLGEAAVRNLAGVASGLISMPGLYGKFNESFWHAILGTSYFNYLMFGTDSSLLSSAQPIALAAIPAWEFSSAITVGIFGPVGWGLRGVLPTPAQRDEVTLRRIEEQEDHYYQRRAEHQQVHQLLAGKHDRPRLHDFLLLGKGEDRCRAGQEA